MASAHRYSWTRSDGTTGKAWRAKWRDAEGRPQGKRGFRTKGEALTFAEDAKRLPVVVVEPPPPAPAPRPPASPRVVVYGDPADREEIARLKRELSNLRRRWTQEEEFRAAAAKLVVEDERKAVQSEWEKFAATTSTVETHVDLYRRGFTVYLLRDADGAVVYVGQSTNVLTRLGSHARDPLKTRAKTATVLRCESFEHMCDVEAFLIDILQPPLNILGISDGAYRLRAEGHYRAIALAGPAPASDWGHHRRSSHDRSAPSETPPVQGALTGPEPARPL